MTTKATTASSRGWWQAPDVCDIDIVEHLSGMARRTHRGRDRLIAMGPACWRPRVELRFIHPRSPCRAAAFVCVRINALPARPGCPRYEGGGLIRYAGFLGLLAAVRLLFGVTTASAAPLFGTNH